MAVRRKYAREFKQEAVQLVRPANMKRVRLRVIWTLTSTLGRWCQKMTFVGA